jgi:hypothetical protein
VWTARGGRSPLPGGAGSGPIATVPAPTGPVATAPSPAAAPDTGSPPPAAPATRPESLGSTELAMPELDSLPAEALDSILRALDEPLAQVGADDLPPDQSGDQELASALAGLEG